MTCARSASNARPSSPTSGSGPCRKCLHAMHRMISERKAAMARAANMMYSAETRLKQRVMDAWRDTHFADRDAKNRKLMLFFVGREEWWKTHVVETWRKVTRNERGIRRFLMKWLFQGMAKTFTAWARYVRRTADERNRGLAKGIAMLSGGVRYKCFLAWANEARTQREERDAILRSKLLQNGALLSAKMVQAWFEYSARRRAAKRRICFGASHAGAAFRTWLQLIDAKRRSEFLEWALGPDFSVLGGKLKAATKVLADQTSEQFDAIRDQFHSFKDQWKDQVLVERKATQEKLDRKVDVQEVAEHARAIDEARDELEAIREQITAQAETQRALSLDSERAATDLSEQMQSLTRDMEAKVIQTHRALDRRAGEEEKALNVVTEELNVIKNTKANHEELLQLVQKLQRRPRPSAPVGVQQLLAVPYPMPPGPAHRRRRRTARAALAARVRVARTAAASAAATAAAAVLRVRKHAAAGRRRRHGRGRCNRGERRAARGRHRDDGRGRRAVPALCGHVGADPDGAGAGPDAEFTPPPGTMSQAEQDAALGITRAGSAGARLRTQTLVPPSSHTAALSARASPTVNAIVQNRRPTSARACRRRAEVAMFASRTERLERSLGRGEMAELEEDRRARAARGLRREGDGPGSHSPTQRARSIETRSMRTPHRLNSIFQSRLRAVLRYCCNRERCTGRPEALGRRVARCGV